MFRHTHEEHAAHGNAIWSVAWAPSDIIVTGSLDETVRCWDLTEEAVEVSTHSGTEKHEILQQVRELDGHQLGVISTSINHDGSLLATTSLDCRMRLWNLNDGSLMKHIRAGPVEAWTCSFAPDGTHIASGSHHGNVNLWQVESGERVHSYSTGNSSSFIMSVGYSPSGKMLAAGGKDGKVYFFDVETGEMTSQQEHAHAKAVRSLAFSPEGRFLLTASDDMNVNVYDPRQQQRVASFAGHTNWVLCVSCSPAGRHFATSSSDKRVKIWDLGQRKCVHSFEEHTDQVWGVAYNKEGSHLVSVGDDCNIHCYEME